MKKAPITKRVRSYERRNGRVRLSDTGWAIVAGIVAFCILLFIASAHTAGAEAQLSAKSGNKPVGVGAPSADRQQSPLGSPAIPIRLGVSSKTATGTASPVFTIQDAVQWVKSHGWDRATVSGAKVVTRAEFLTSKQVSDILQGESVGLPENSVVCYVEIQGNFTYAGAQGRLYSYPRGFVVFNAQNGYILMSGGLP